MKAEKRMDPKQEKFLNEFDRMLEKGIAEVLAQFYSKVGNMVTIEDFQTKLKEVYSIAWNKYAQENGLEHLQLDRECKLKPDIEQILKVFLTADKNWDNEKLKAALKVVKDSKSPNSEGFGYALETVIDIIMSLKQEKAKNSFTSEQFDAVIEAIDKQMLNATNTLPTDADKGLKEFQKLIEPLEALQELYDINLGAANARATVSLSMLFRIGDQIDIIAEDLFLGDDFDKLTPQKAEQKAKVTKEIKIQMLALAGITIACSLVAAILLSEVLVGVAVGGAAGAAVSTFITTQAPALGALVGVALPGTTVQMALGAMAAAGSAAGIVGIYETKSYDVENIALLAAVRENTGVSACKKSLRGKLTGILELIGKSQEVAAGQAK